MSTTRVWLGYRAKKFSIPINDTVEVILAVPIGGSLGNFGGLTVTAIPDAGGTLDVEFSTSPFEDLEAGTAVWEDWALGAATITMTDSLAGPVTALRATATANSGTLQIVP